MKSNYSALYPQETTRLIRQAKLIEPLDRQLIKAALEHSPTLVLDLGCAQGYLTRSLLSGLPGVEKVIGVDKETELISQAQRGCQNTEGLWFQSLDLEEGNFGSVIKQLTGSHITLVLLASVLPHLADPVKTLSRLNQALPEGSQVCVRATDDTSVISYPDRQMKEAVQLTAQAPQSSDRNYGRKLHSHLLEAGFIDIRLFTYTLLSPNLSPKDREILFEARVGWRSMGYKSYPGQLSRTQQENLSRLEVLLTEIESQMQQPESFYAETFYGAVATSGSEGEQLRSAFHAGNYT